MEPREPQLSQDFREIGADGPPDLRDLLAKAVVLIEGLDAELARYQGAAVLIQDDGTVFLNTNSAAAAAIRRAWPALAAIVRGEAAPADGQRAN